METKKFKDLKIDDEIFVLSSKKKLYSQRDQYGNLYSDGKVNSIIKIDSLEYSEKKDSLLINKRYVSSYSRHQYDLALPIENRKDSIYQDTDGTMYFADNKEAIGYIKNHVISAINYEEQILNDAKKSCEKRIEEIRKSYWDVLNNKI